MASGADVNAKDSGGKTVLMSRYAEYKRFGCFVERDRIDLDIKDTQGGTALMLAVDLGHLEVVNALLGHDKIEPTNITTRARQH